MNYDTVMGLMMIVTALLLVTWIRNGVTKLYNRIKHKQRILYWEHYFVEFVELVRGEY